MKNIFNKISLKFKAKLGKIKNSWDLLSKKRKLFYGISLIVLCFILFTPLFAGASLGDVILKILSGLLYGIVYALGFIASKLMVALVFFATWKKYTTGITAVLEGWKIARDICNMFFIFILLIISFATIIGVEAYSYKKWLVKVIIFSILINFSKMITGLLIDVSQIVMLTFVSGFKDATVNNFAKGLHLDKLMSKNVGAGTANESGSFDVFVVMLLACIMLVVLNVVLVIMIVMLVGRILTLWVLAILSPFAFMLQASPFGGKYASEWWQSLSKNLISGPILAMFIYLCMYTIQASFDENISGNSEKIRISDMGGGQLKEKDNESGISADTTLEGSGGEPFAIQDTSMILDFIIVIAMMIAAIRIAGSLGVMGSSFAGQAMGKLQNAGKRALKMGAVGVGAVTGANLVARRIKAYRDIKQDRKKSKDYAAAAKFMQTTGAIKERVGEWGTKKRKQAFDWADKKTGGRLSKAKNWYEDKKQKFNDWAYGKKNRIEAEENKKNVQAMNTAKGEGIDSFESLEKAIDRLTAALKEDDHGQGELLAKYGKNNFKELYDAMISWEVKDSEDRNAINNISKTTKEGLVARYGKNNFGEVYDAMERGEIIPEDEATIKNIGSTYEEQLLLKYGYENNINSFDKLSEDDIYDEDDRKLFRIVQREKEVKDKEKASEREKQTEKLNDLNRVKNMIQEEEKKGSRAEFDRRILSDPEAFDKKINEYQKNAEDASRRYQNQKDLMDAVGSGIKKGFMALSLIGGGGFIPNLLLSSLASAPGAAMLIRRGEKALEESGKADQKDAGSYIYNKSSDFSKKCATKDNGELREIMNQSNSFKALGAIMQLLERQAFEAKDVPEIRAQLVARGADEATTNFVEDQIRKQFPGQAKFTEKGERLTDGELDRKLEERMRSMGARRFMDSIPDSGISRNVIKALMSASQNSKEAKSTVDGLSPAQQKEVARVLHGMILAGEFRDSANLNKAVAAFSSAIESETDPEKRFSDSQEVFNYAKSRLDSGDSHFRNVKLGNVVNNINLSTTENLKYIKDGNMDAVDFMSGFRDAVASEDQTKIDMYNKVLDELSTMTEAEMKGKVQLQDLFDRLHREATTGSRSVLRDASASLIKFRDKRFKAEEDTEEKTKSNPKPRPQRPRNVPIDKGYDYENSEFYKNLRIED